jgi:exopolyphosphatase/guanosine-5'-triphosphate,3'-diphosphate pyrophosphatase
VTPRAGSRQEPVAAVDCGSNSTRLLVAGPKGATLDRLMRITRLGEGVDRTGRLSPEAIRRTVEVLDEYRDVLDRRGVIDVMATATSAVRDASNSRDFLEQAAKALGTEPRVLAGDEEGRLSYRGATAELDPEDGPFLVVDVGGGSTELVTAAGDAQGGVVAVSLQVGCVRLTERYLRGDPPTAEEQANGRHFVAGLVSEALAEHPELGEARCVVGLAGTVSALVMLNLGLETYERQLVHHSHLARQDVDRLIRELAAVPLSKRRGRPGLEPDRADVIVGGAIVLGAVLDSVPFDQLLASESDILDGIVAALLDSREP